MERHVRRLVLSCMDVPTYVSGVGIGVVSCSLVCSAVMHMRRYPDMCLGLYANMHDEG